MQANLGGVEGVYIGYDPNSSYNQQELTYIAIMLNFSLLLLTACILNNLNSIIKHINVALFHIHVILMFDRKIILIM